MRKPREKVDLSTCGIQIGIPTRIRRIILFTKTQGFSEVMATYWYFGKEMT